jgi:hypothetical protein
MFSLDCFPDRSAQQTSCRQQPPRSAVDRFMKFEHDRFSLEPGTAAVPDLERSAARAPCFDALRLGVFAPLRFNSVDFNAETQRRKDAERIHTKARVAGGDF